MAWTMLGPRKLDFVQQQRFLGQILDELLLDYSNQHPWVININSAVDCLLKLFKHSLILENLLELLLVGVFFIQVTVVHSDICSNYCLNCLSWEHILPLYCMFG
jgi:uncharacterized membrane protein